MSGEITARLRRDAIGLREVLFQSITAMASAAAVTASIPPGAALVVGSLPLSVLIALVACVFTASCANVSTRAFAPARVRVPPGFLARLHPGYRSPATGIAVLSAVGIPEFGFKTGLTAPMSYAGPVVGVWTAAGVVVLVILIRRHLVDTPEMRAGVTCYLGMNTAGALLSWTRTSSRPRRWNRRWSTCATPTTPARRRSARNGCPPTRPTAEYTHGCARRRRRFAPDLATAVPESPHF